MHTHHATIRPTRLLAVVTMLAAASMITGCGDGAGVAPDPGAGDITLVSVPVPQPLRHDCNASPDLIERRAAAGNSIEGCQLPTRAAGKERRTPRRCAWTPEELPHTPDAVEGWFASCGAGRADGH